MKKAVALFVSVLFYMGAFAWAFIYASKQNILYFAYILPPAVALYFVIAGNIFVHRLGLNRLLLWFVLNFAGGICSWGILIACFPHILFNGFILVYLVPAAISFAIVWGVSGIGFLCVKQFQQISGTTPSTKTHTRIRKVGASKSDKKADYLNEDADDGDILQIVHQFRSGKWTFLLLETEQCNINISTWYAPEGNCTVTIMLKLHGKWKALRKTFSIEQGISMFLSCYDKGCLYEDFNGWYDVTADFQKLVNSVQESVDKAQPTVRPKQPGVWSERLKNIVVTVCIMLVIPSVCSLCLGVMGIASMPSPSDYEDMGVHTFYPYRVLPVTVGSSSSRKNQATTAYEISYKTSDGMGYWWEAESGSKDSANKILAAGESVDRRVLSIRENGKYITVDAELTADTYVAKRQQGCFWLIGLSVSHWMLSLGTWVAVKRYKEKKE